MRLRLAAALALMTLVTACGPATQKIDFETVPPGAEIDVGDQHLVSPGSLDLAKNSDYKVIAHKQGYQSEEVAITHSTSWLRAFFMSAFCLPCVPLGLSDGTFDNLSPETVAITLQPSTSQQALQNQPRVTK